VADYERETGHRVEVRYAGSQSILASAELSGQGDLFLPADSSYIDEARGRGMIAQAFPIATMTGVLVVPADNPKNIANWNDLLREGVSIAQAEPDIAAIGKLTREQLTKTGRWELLRARTRTFKGTVNYVANDVALKAVDAGIVWDVVARPMPELKMIELPELAGIQARIEIALLANSKQPLEALKFARYLTASDRGLPRFRECGFARVETGGKWESSKP
jgi:molybdate transport system substrate-binding protein